MTPTINELHRELQQWRHRCLVAEAQLRQRAPLTAADGSEEEPLPAEVPNDHEVPC